MADVTLTGITIENPSDATTYDVDFVSGHSVGDVVRYSGAVITGATQAPAGIVTRVGDANGKKTQILVRGFVDGLAGAGAAANAVVYNDGDNTASDTEPAGAAGTAVWILGHCITATRAYINVTHYEKGA